MSLRITVVDSRRQQTRSPMNRTLREYRPLYAQNSNNNSSFYIRSPKHVSRRSKSPFQKYEECIKAKIISPSPNNQSNKSQELNLNCKMPSSEQSNNKNTDQIKDDEKSILCSVCRSKLIEEKKDEIEKPKKIECLLDSKEKNLTKSIPIVRHIPLTVKKIKPIISQPPLGSIDFDNKKINFDDDSFFDVHLDPKTAEQFINLLIMEDTMLRRKIAEGQVDDQTMRKLERLTELRKKYIEYKNSQEKFVEIPIVHEKSKIDIKTIPPPPEEFKNPAVFKLASKPLNKKSSFGSSKVKSLSDPAFSHELSRHPLVRE
ncbi:unnamed protein product [Brachionus calyciflorus]|uniref:Uncharacterized protein n=1 Tax=Brachionus calyciflorus TaxID=104777 RepID=A0A814DZ01_9BILA|nr:unnamed protein product [Brachionus calyciflorus]